MNAIFSRRGAIALLAALLLALGLSTTARADDADPPSRVARISYLDGSVSLQPGGTGDWGAAAKNRPVTIGDKLWVDQNSRAELQAGQLSIHLGSMTALSFLNLDGTVAQMRLAEGQMNFRVREIRQGDLYEVDTPNLAFTIRQAGAFRIDVGENGDFTGVTVIRGEGEIATAGRTLVVHPGERAVVNGTDADATITSDPAPPADELDQWAQSRDLKEENSPSARYVSRDTVGYSDLDDYGTWNEQPDYGPVWSPSNVDADWSPYSNGYWNWVGPWGWTWVDYAPWGFAPFHYGRWIYGGGRWGWCPGPIYATPYYGPAFVGFVGGFGAGFGFGIGFGAGFGWFPLGWGEPYHPWYHCGAGYYHNVNIHNTRITNMNSLNASYHNYNYQYAHNASAVTVASHGAFVNGQAIHGTRVNSAALRGAQVTNGVNASPTRSSYFGASNAPAHGNVATPPSSVQNRSVVSRSTPAGAASHLPVHTMNNAQLRPAETNTYHAASRGVVSSASTSITRQAQLNANRPPSTGRQAVHSNTPSTRSWSAQGNNTDSGRAPQGFGSGPSSTPTRAASLSDSNRPPWARSNAIGSYHGSNGGARQSVNRPPAGYNRYRTSTPPSYRGTSAPRSYSAPRPPSAPHGTSAPHGSSGAGSHGGGGGGHHR